MPKRIWFFSKTSYNLLPKKRILTMYKRKLSKNYSLILMFSKFREVPINVRQHMFDKRQLWWQIFFLVELQNQFKMLTNAGLLALLIMSPASSLRKRASIAIFNTCPVAQFVSKWSELRDIPTNENWSPNARIEKRFADLPRAWAKCIY